MHSTSRKASERGPGSGPVESDALPLFAVAAPGLEGLVAGELRQLGIPCDVRPGGAGWRGTPRQLYDACLRLRTSGRVLLRIAEFRARSFPELERHARRVAWERVLAPGASVRLRVTSRKSRLYHERAIEERLLRWLEERPGPLASAEDGEPQQLLVIRGVRDRWTISADACGESLHRRGYREAGAKAPLRETLAAAMLLAGGWDRRSPLVDPLCGSGTLPIEAALLARAVPPGLASAARVPRAYAFQRWPGYDASLWRDVVARAASEAHDGALAPIVGSDRDRGAVEAALANAERAGVRGDLELSARPLSALEAPLGPGFLVTNPPWGVRVGEREALRDLYARLGALARERLAGWRVTLLSADARLHRQLQLPLREVLRTVNGGIGVGVWVGNVPA